MMIDWALKNVAILVQATAFLKITGRYRVLNVGKLNAIIKRGLIEEPRLRFISTKFLDSEPPAVDSSVFWSDRDFFVNEMTSLWSEIDDQGGTYLEHVMASRLLGLARRNRIGLFPIDPIIWARRGGNGDYVMRRRHIVTRTVQQLFSKPRLEYL